jgi:hypothetical protein
MAAAADHLANAGNGRRLLYIPKYIWMSKAFLLLRSFLSLLLLFRNRLLQLSVGSNVMGASLPK